jgi:putative membrane protein
MRRLAILGVAGGLLLLTALVVYEGWDLVRAALARAGWPLLSLVPAHLVPLALDTQGWRVLLASSDPRHRAGPGFLLWVAAVREAVARLLPAVGVAGEVVGIRLARLRLTDTAAVSASVVVEVLLTIVVLYLFCGLGILLLAHIAGGLGEVWVIAAGLLLSLPLPLFLFWLLRRGAVFGQLQHWAARLLAREQVALLDGARLDAAIGRLLAQPRCLARALGWQLAGYVAGSFETWFALALLGHPVTPATAIAIEALTQATRHATFLVPAGLGVQEAAVLLFGYLAGVGGDVALSLALVKRMREIVFGVPVLLSWQWVEARQLRRARAAG